MKGHYDLFLRTDSRRLRNYLTKISQLPSTRKSASTCYRIVQSTSRMSFWHFERYKKCEIQFYRWFSFAIRNVKSIHYGLETVSYLGPKIRDILPKWFKDYENSNIFKSNIKWMQRDSNPQPLSSLTNTQPFGWVFVNELNGCGFESRCNHLNFRYRACFEQEVPWHSDIYTVRMHSETRTWHDKNIHSNTKVCKPENFVSDAVCAKFV